MKINLRESLNKIDLATSNKYDLLNTFNSKKLSDNNKKKLAEAIENNSIASINKILHESNEKVFTVKVYQDYPFVAEVIDNSIVDKNGEGKVLKKFTNRDALDDFANELISKGYVNYQGYSKNKSLHESEEQLFKVVIQSGVTKRDFESGLYEHEAEEIVDYYDGRWIDENGFEWDMYVEEDDDQLTEASYGGAYDIEDDMFFTKEEIVEFVEEICEYLGDIFGYQYDINNVYMDGPRKLYINIYDNNYIEVESTFNIDMRKIRKPSDLSKVYGLTIKNWFQKAFAREYRDAGLDESLNKKNLKEDLSDLDLILNTPADTKQFNEEIFRALKNLVSEYKKDLDSLDQWAPESEKEPFVKKWYKLADKCQEIAKNGIRGITGYGRLKDAIKLKVVDLARSVDNTFPWYTKNRLEKFGELEESLTEDLDFFDIVDNIPLNVLNDDICQGDVFTGFYFNSEESANRFANYLERKGFITDQSEDSSYIKGFNYKVSVFDNIEGKYFDDETYDESLNEALEYETIKDPDYLKSILPKDLNLTKYYGSFITKGVDIDKAIDIMIKNGWRIYDDGKPRFGEKYLYKNNNLVNLFTGESPRYAFVRLVKSNNTKNESLNEDFEDEIDLDYETDFDEGSVEEGNVFTEGGVDYAWIEREAGPIYLDFDKWAVWSAREYVDPREFITLYDDGKGYDFDKDAFEKKAMAAPIVYFVVEEDTGFIDWGPEDNEIAAKDFLNGKKEDWENDMDESLNEDKELREYYAVNLHYEDIGDGREYDYKADYDDVLEYLMDYCVDEDDAPEDTQEYMEWVVNNFDSLLKKYEYDILEYFYEDASQEEYEERNRPYEPEYDPMSDEVY